MSDYMDFSFDDSGDYGNVDYGDMNFTDNYGANLDSGYSLGNYQNQFDGYDFGQLNSDYNFNNQGGQGFDLNSLFAQNNFGQDVPQQGFNFNDIGAQQAAPYQMPQIGDQGGTENVLAQLFNGKGGVAGMDGIMKLAAAAYTENQRKKAGSSAVDKLLAQQKNIYDPAAQMRNTAMNQFDQATADPMSVPIVKQQIDAFTQAQRIKDAAAGRRSNDIAGNVQIQGKAGEVANNYLNTMSRMYSQPQGASLMQSLYPQAMQNDANQGGALAMAISNMNSLDPELKQAMIAKLKKDAGIA